MTTNNRESESSASTGACQRIQLKTRYTRGIAGHLIFQRHSRASSVERSARFLSGHFHVAEVVGNSRRHFVFPDASTGEAAAAAKRTARHATPANRVGPLRCGGDFPSRVREKQNVGGTGLGMGGVQPCTALLIDERPHAPHWLVVGVDGE